MVSGEFITNEADVGLPPLQSSRRAVWEYYRIEFLPNGYPGRRTGDELFAHPIYGPYVIADYTAQYRRTQEPRFLEAACRVADAAIDQMTEVGGGLAFLYSQEKSRVSSKKGLWYSGLTQARYVEVFNKLLAQPGTERYREPLSRILISLTVPVEEGGVARYTDDGGLVIEEYPSLAPDCTLNGWTTATVILADYARRTGDPQAWELFRLSVKGLERLIGLFDVPEYATSRYKLTGPATIRLTAEKTDVKVGDCRVVMPASGVFAANDDLDPAGKNLAEGPKVVGNGATQSFVFLLSRITWPAPNRLRFQIEAEEDGIVGLEIGDGPFNPLISTLAPQFYRDLGRFPVSRGENCIEVPVEWVDAEIIAHPTNFGKRIAGRQFNQYHWIHVDTLGKIVSQADSDILRYYRERWSRSPEKWPEISEYQTEDISLERFDPKRHK